MRKIEMAKKGGVEMNLFSKIKSSVDWKLYALKIKLFPSRRFSKKPILNAKNRQLLFYIAFLAIPVIQFCIFYIGVNFQFIALAFQKYNLNIGAYEFNGLNNIKSVIANMTLEGMPLNTAIFNSLKIYAIGLVVGLPLALFFSYYIYKKKPVSGVFRVVIFLPSIISVIVMVILFRYMTDRVFPEALKLFDIRHSGLLSTPETRFGTIIFFGIWFGFGSGVLIYTGSMSRISPDITEYASLDGVSDMQEFFHIILPLIYPTVATFLTVGVAGIFINQANLYDFYGINLPSESLYTIGYYLFKEVMAGETAGVGNQYLIYSYAAAAGLIFTLVAAPVTIFVKWALERFGPSTEF